VALLAAVLVTVTTGCGVSGERSPRALDDARLPPDQLAGPTGGSGVLADGHVYMVSSERLKAVVRNDTGDDVSNLLRALFEGPTSGEVNGDLRTAIPAGTRLAAATVHDGIADVDVTKGFAGVAGPEQILAVAQIVLTATEASDVTSVVISVNGQPIDAPRADGSLAAVVTRGDYAALVVR
jgi:spore germination protein GerM